MLENASRQLTLVVAVLIASVALILTVPPKVGLDLKGGTSLAYRIDFEEAVRTGKLDGNLTQSDKDEIMNQTISILTDRIDPEGTIAPTIQRRGDTGILIELPQQYETDALAVQKRIETLGSLEMRIVADDTYSFVPDKEPGQLEDPDPVQPFDLAEETKRLEDWLAVEENKAAIQEDPERILIFNTLPSDDGGRQSKWLRWFPRKIEPSVDNATADVARWEAAYGLAPQSKFVPAFDSTEYNGGIIKEGSPPFLVEFLPVNMHEEYFTGEQLAPRGIQPSFDDRGRPALAYALRAEYRSDYADWSEKYIDQQSAIILNGLVESAPTFISRIPGNGQITGDFTQNEVQQLVDVLRAGSLQVAPVLESRVEIGATLGESSVFLGGVSIAVGGALVLLFILWYYKLAGLVAFGGIVLNIVVLYAIMLFLGATLTLPGIAGLVLTVGMAVDANILIYERIREELRRGKELLQAVRAGFERAIVTILDANITTFLAGVVLYNVGVGPVRGFAVTLMVGIVTTLFTAYFVSRLIFHFLLEKNVLRSFDVRSMFGELTIDFVGRARPALTVSIVVIVAGLLFMFLAVPKDTMLGLDFTGGANLQVVTKETVAVDSIRTKLDEDKAFSAKYPRPVVNVIGGDGTESDHFSVKLKLTDERLAEITEAQRKARAAGDDYEAPYIGLIEGALGDLLVDPAYSNESVTTDVDSDVTDFGSIELHFTGPVAVADVKERLKKEFGIRNDDGLVVRDPGKSEAETPATAEDLVVEWNVEKGTEPDALFPMVVSPLAKLEGPDGSEVKLSNPIPESETIQGQIVGELRNAAIAALIIAMFLIVMFIRVRFHEYSYGIAAVAALVHDVLVTLVILVALNYSGLVTAEIDLPMIAAFLTIIGYSINDTIVIFDRVRENLTESARLGEKSTFGGILNRSINQTLSRTILTTTTTLFVVLSQFVVNFGSGSSLEGFSLALVIGLISGTYSTMFIATPVVRFLRAREELSMSKDDSAAPPAQPSPAA